MFFTYLHHVSLGYILLLFISITSLARLNAQANLISYESNVCATELFQTKLICLTFINIILQSEEEIFPEIILILL